jgi:hypothetical protein
MTISRLRARPRGLEKYGRARLGRPTVLLLVVLRAYAIVAVLIAVYSFVHAVR